jgi:RHH-type transcriptional regulator, proline utilization regulon repressor / proline dehydrogenase / delta 1-pyrroline-5-carboxylate dehydrogenase
VKAGNIYINRNVIGAIVGVQPFGGRGLSGTGPKAGGPHYLNRLVQDVPATRAIGGKLDPGLADLVVWLDEHGHPEQAQIARQLGEASPAGRVIELPGPVGERNSYALHPRGTVLLRPASTDGLFHQLAAALATGNDVIIEGELAAGRLLGNLPSRVQARIRSGHDSPSAALVEAGPDELGAILRDLAARRGALIPVQAATSAQIYMVDTYCLDWLVEEVSTSVNTTAAGGNASLMTLV